MSSIIGRAGYPALSAGEFEADSRVWNPTTQTYTVTQMGQFPKAGLADQQLFRTDGPPRLVLITCGGSFHPSTRSYADNVVIIAEPDYP